MMCQEFMITLPAGLNIIVDNHEADDDEEFGWEWMTIKVNTALPRSRFFAKGDKRVNAADFCVTCRSFIERCWDNGYIVLSWEPGDFWVLVLEQDAGNLLSQLKGH